MPFIPDKPIEPAKKSGFIPDKPTPITVGSQSMLPDSGFNPSKELAWTEPSKNLIGNFVPDVKKTGYSAFVDDLRRIQAGTRGVIRETVEYGQGTKKDYEPLKRFKNALENKEYVTAHEVFKELDPQSSSIILNVLQGTAQGTAEVFLDMLTDPTVWITAGVGKVTKPLINLAGKSKYLKSSIEKFSQTPAGKKAIEWFVYRGGQPKEYQGMAEQRLRGIQKGQQLASETGEMLSKGLSRAQQQRAGQILKGGISVSERESELRQITDKARQSLQQVGSKAVESNLLDEGTFIQNFKTYSPRLYRKWEQSGKSVSDYFKLKPFKIEGKRFLHKGDIPAEVRAEMGEILEPAYPVAKGIAQVTKDVETANLFNKVNANPEWVKTAEEINQAPETLKDFVLLEGKRYGNLNGKYVTTPIANDINEITHIPTTAERIYNKYLSAWKFTKTVLNPAGHFRNIMSNTILLSQGGVDHFQQLRLIPKAAKEILGKGKYYQEANEAGLLGREFYGGEIKSFLDNWSQADSTIWDKIGSISSKTSDKLGKIYQGEEQIFKLAKFISDRENGIGVKEAVRSAEKYLFNYEKTSKFIQIARKSPFGAPFITFASKALPNTAETAIKNPLEMYKYVSFIKAIENQAKDHLGITDDDLNTVKRNRRGIVMVLPDKDKEGNLQTLDLSYIMPWGDVGETGGFLGLSPTLTPSNPILKAVSELGMNYSTYAGSPIFYKTDTLKERSDKLIDYLVKNTIPLPTWVPKGWSWDKLVKSIQERPDYWGRVRGVPKVLADIILGVKISPVDVGLIKKQSLDEINRERQRLNFEMRKQDRTSINQEERNRNSKTFQEKMKVLYGREMETNEIFRILAGGGKL